MRAIPARPMIVAMSDRTETDTVNTVEEIKPADPYGDVALGVECAWPQDFLAMTRSAEQSAQ
jgi:hypothetical protein